MDKSVDKLEISLIGPPRVVQNGSEIHFRTRKTLALLAYLAVENKAKTREHLAQFLWAESDDARQMLRTTLAHFKHALNDAAEILRVEQDAVALDPRIPLQLDTRALEDAANATGAGRDTPELGSLLAGVVPLYRGDFLDGLLVKDAPAFDDWVRDRRERYHLQFTRVLQALVLLQQARGDLRAASSTAERWHKHDPLDEEAARWVMRLQLVMNEPAAARQAFEQLRDALKRELNASPSPETLALAQSLTQAASVETGHARAPASRASLTVAPSPQQFIASTPLIGRATEFARMAKAWLSAAGGEMHLIVVQGEAGIGKTRLATEFARYAATGGADVLSGRAFETGGQLPYQPLVDALRPRLERENAPEDLLSDVWLGELARILPELRERYPDLTAQGGDAPARLYEAIARLCMALAERAPLLMLIDDVQWADTASLDALQYAAKRWQQAHARIALLFTVRAEAVAGMTGWFAEAGRGAHSTILTLEALSEENTLQLVRSLAANETGALNDLAAWLYRETSGQPFFIMETLKALLERGDVVATRAHDAWVMDFSATPTRPLEISIDMQQIVLARINRLDATAADLVAAASVLAGASEFELVRRVAGTAENAGLDALDGLLASGLLRETNGRIAVGHDKIRDVVYGSLRETRKRVLHRRAFETLTAQSGSPAARAHHALAAGLAGHAFHAFVEAGNEALNLSAPRDAITYYERARTLADDTLINPELYLQLGRAYELTDEPARASETYRELLAHAQATEQAAAQAKALNRLAILALQDLDEGNGHALATQALERATAAQDEALIAETNWTVTQIFMYMGDNVNALAHGEQTLAQARVLNQPELLARTLNVLAYIYGGVGRVLRAVDAANESRDLFRALGNRAMEVDSLVQVSSAQRRMGQTSASTATARSAYALSRATENEWGAIDATLQGALTLLEGGEFGEALADAQRGLDAARTRHMPILMMIGQLMLGVIYREMLAYAEARTVLTGMLNVKLVPAIVATVQAELAAVCALAGDWQAALDYAARAFVTGAHPLMLIRTGLPLEAEALVRGRAAASAQKLVEDFRGLVHDNPRYEIVYLRAAAVLAHDRGEPAQATAHLERAATLANALDARTELWKIYAALGRTAEARERLRQLAATIPEAGLREPFLARGDAFIGSPGQSPGHFP